MAARLFALGLRLITIHGSRSRLIYFVDLANTVTGLVDITQNRLIVLLAQRLLIDVLHSLLHAEVLHIAALLA